ncbi:MAG: ferritin-like domain-containing protein [Chloroflexi bacterium]|nr:MAG: ferritin-like domain-containing protein [Chloroflexota bacterium]RLC97082.1 MAG: ferritin-like domain-containing protein [Chloroflexota bacterium]
MTSEQVVDLLNKDLEGEHAAIIQYLGHAYAMGEGEMACEIEAIAREEMRHFDWLAETIVSLGGVPSLVRGDMRTGGDSVSDWMRNNVLQEDDAIALYEEHIAAIDDPRTKRLLERILSDERSHRLDFAHFVDKAKKQGAEDLRGERQDRVAQILNWGIEHEYTVILQYLLHGYMARSEEVKEQMEDQAVNEMQHLGWLAEEMVGGGGTPRIEHTEVDQSTRPVDMLRADIKIEKEVAAGYDRAEKEVDDAGLKRLLSRIRDHELYHVEVFSDLLRQEEGQG